MWNKIMKEENWNMKENQKGLALKLIGTDRLPL